MRRSLCAAVLIAVSLPVYEWRRGAQAAGDD
jgi:hypothetical protein